MLDPRFYSVLATPTVASVAGLAPEAIVHGPADTVLTGLAPFETAQPGDLTFCATARADLFVCQAAACYIQAGASTEYPDQMAVIECADPRGAFAKASASMARRIELASIQELVHPNAVISTSAVVEPGAIIGENASIGEDTRIGAGAVIGPGVQVGRSSTIGANATVFCSLIGDNVTLFPGAVVGENGFGLPTDGKALIPHFGRVILQDGVTIGANSCVDRGMLGDTVIGERCHIDNLCHIGHNVRVGRGSVMAAFAGVSGSSTVGDQVMFGGRVGLADHVEVGQGARIAAGAAVLQDVPAGETWAGYPAKPIKGWMREVAWLRRSAQKKQPNKDQ